MLREMILGTDWFTDCDDVTAVRLITYYHRIKRIRLLGINIDACMELSAPSLDSFLRLCRARIPFALDHEANDYDGKPTYQTYLSRLPGKFRKNSETEKSVPFYRRLLSRAKHKAELLEIGFSQSMTALLQSLPDGISPLNGVELVKEKVSRLWIMAGKWSEPNGGKEYNFSANRRASEAAAILCDKWPTPVTFLGWEVGFSVISGKNLAEDDPLRQAMLAYGTKTGRMSWDPMLIQLAVAGDPEQAGYSTVRGKASVDAGTGRNYFREDPAGLHEYVVKSHPDPWYEERLESDLEKAYLHSKRRS